MKCLFYFLIGLFLISCHQPDASLHEQFFTQEELILLDNFIEEIDERICPNSNDKKFHCYNTYFEKAFHRLYSMKGANYGLNSLELIDNLDTETFDLLFYFTDAHHRIDIWSPWIKRKQLNIKDKGKFVNFVDEYCRQSNNESLMESWKLSYKFTQPGPMTTGYLYKNAAVINYENDTDRLIFSILYVILDYNISFAS